MTMTRQHFKLIAGVILTLPEKPHGKDIREMVAEAFAKELPVTNPSFNPSRFLRACGVES